MKAQTLSPKITCSNPHPPFTSMMQHTFLSPPGTLHHSNHTIAAILLQSQATWARNGHCKDFASRFSSREVSNSDSTSFLFDFAVHFTGKTELLSFKRMASFKLKSFLMSYLHWKLFWIPAKPQFLPFGAKLKQNQNQTQTKTATSAARWPPLFFLFCHSVCPLKALYV